MEQAMSGEHQQKVDDCKLELDKIKKWINQNRMDSQVRYLVCYAVIRTSGTIEVIYKNMIYEHLSQGVNNEARKFLTESILESPSNPKTTNIKSVLEKINSDWSEAFEIQCKSCGKKSDLNSLVQLRNDFSHGGGITQSIETIIKYFDGAVEILEILESIVTTST